MQHLVLHPQNVISDEDVSIQNLFLLSIYCHCKSFLSVKTDGYFSYEQLTSMHSILYIQANLACRMFIIRTHYYVVYPYNVIAISSVLVVSKRFLYCYNILIWIMLWWNEFVASNCVLALKMFLHKFNPIWKCRNLELFFYIGKYFLLYSIMLSIFFCYEQQQFKGCLKLLNLETCSQMTLIRFS